MSGQGVEPQQGWERWVTAPRQARARDTLERVLDAGAELLAEAGWQGFAIGEVCRRAGVAPGTLYDRVAGKEELFLALHDRELVRITAGGVAELRALAARHRLSTPRLVDGVVDVLAAHYRREHALLRAFILRAAADPRVRDEGARHLARLEEESVGVLLARRADFVHRNSERAARTAHRLVTDSLSWRTAFGADFHPAGESDEAWAGRLRVVVRAFLLSG